MGKKKEVVYENNRLKGKLLTTEVCNKLESLLRLDAERGFIQDLKNIIFDLSPTDVDLIRTSGSNEFVELESSKGELENIQTVGVAYMYFAKRLILGDSVGLGKTVEICGLCNLLEADMAKDGFAFRFLYLTGKNLVAQSRDEMIRFTGNYTECVYGEKAKVQRFCNENMDDIPPNVVGSHSLVNSIDFQEYMRFYNSELGYCPFDILIIDEAGDILKNSNTQIYKNAQYIASMFDRVILLNATAFEKELRMFYNQINFIDDTFLPTKTAFQKEYEILNYASGRPYPEFSGKYRNADKFRELVAYRYLARTRKSSGAIMENCSATPVIVPLSKEQKKLLTLTSMPGMVYDCPSYFNMGIETNVHTTPKLKALVKLINEDLAMTPSILIYAHYKDAQNAIKEVLESQGIESYVMNGSTSQAERESLINKFKLGDIRVLITNVQKGLNFGNCDVCIFYNYDPNPNNMIQFEGRMTRSYNIEGKHVYLLLSEGKELKSFKNIIADRAQASDLFAGSDFSCVLSILLDKDTLKGLS